MAVVAQPEAGRRVRAARVYAGIKSVDKLAEKIGPGLGRTTLYGIEAGRAPLRRPAALAIAEACDLPVAFFEADFSRLAEIAQADPAADFERELEDAVAPSGQPADSSGGAARPHVVEGR